MVQLVVVTALLVLAWFGWRWRMATVPPPMEVQATTPTVWTVPTPTVRSPYLPPVFGPTFVLEP
jgi:hypothetical protein